MFANTEGNILAVLQERQPTPGPAPEGPSGAARGSQPASAGGLTGL